MPGDREKFINAGMTDYLSKPVKINELVRIIKSSRPVSEQIDSTADALPLTTENAITVDHIATTMGLEIDETQAIVLDMLDIFMTETSELWHNILDAAVLDDENQLYRAAHTIKSSSVIIGAHRFSECAEQLARAVNNKQLSRIPAIIENMKIEKDVVFSTIEKLRGELSAQSLHD